MNLAGLIQIQNELLELVLGGSGLEFLVSRFSEIIDHPIIVTNTSFYVLAASENANLQEREYITFNLDNAEWGTGMVQGKAVRNRSLMLTLKNSNTTLGFMFILEPDNPTELLQISEQASLVFALQLTKQNDLLALERSYKDVFIFDLLYGNIESEEEIITRGSILGWNMLNPHGVIVFEMEDYEHFSEDKQLATLLYEIIGTILNDLGEKGILMRKKGEVILILPMLKETRKEQRAYMKLIVGKAKALVEERLPERVVRVGIGRNYSSPTDIFRSYQEAKVALELGSLISSYVSTPFFVELGLARILYNHDLQELRTFYVETLGELERYDSSQGGDLMETLENYLTHRCDLKSTANAMYLHPNTLRYRLKKIEEILGISLDDLDSKLDILAALKIKYLKKI